MAIIKLEHDLNLLAETFQIERNFNCEHLENWLKATSQLTDTEAEILDNMHDEMNKFGDYWNEEELKIRFVGAAFYIAKVDFEDKVRVFYERPMTATINGFKLSVISDCMVASSKAFNAPRNPYFFLQEFKKGKGEKVDPEAQMLTAMLIAQYLNADGKPTYGGFLVGSEWRFATLVDKTYCISRKFDAARKDDILQIVFILRQLKSLILNR